MARIRQTSLLAAVTVALLLFQLSLHISAASTESGDYNSLRARVDALEKELRETKDAQEEASRLLKVEAPKGAKDAGSVTETTGGATYIRWGSTKCPSGPSAPSSATVVYEGYGAGGRYNQQGGGSEIICAASTPEWADVIPGCQGTGAVYGVEYRFTSNDSPFKLDNNDQHALSLNDMPCVMCHVQARSQQIMIPAKKVCPAGWTLEYWGYLASAYHLDMRTSFICLDEKPEVIPGSSAATLSLFLYPVESICNAALPCPPYVEGNELSCVVCTR